MNLARHGDELTLEKLFKKVDELISAEGMFFLLMPAYRDQEIEVTAKKNSMFILKKVLVKQSPFHDAFRIMYAFSKKKSANQINEEITIKDKEDGYTSAFIEYLRDYYLLF